jgi:hypothetical protein
MSFIWTDQASTKDARPSFTSPTGQTIRLPPRRYILSATTPSQPTQQQIAEINSFVTEFHVLATAPEPLSRLTSHLQIFSLKDDPTFIIISLTNTSSRAFRQRIFTTLMSILNLTPATMVIQEQNKNFPASIYTTPNQAVLLTALLETKQNKEEHLMENPPEIKIWEANVIELLRHHRPPVMQSQLETMIRTESVTTEFPIPSSSIRLDTTSAPTTKKTPTFATFDHGDHIHVIFSVRHTNNASRHLNTILNFLRATFEGSSEAHTTLQHIRFPTRFISYLVRKGLSTFHKYGARLIAILKPLTSALLQYDTTDLPSTSTGHCEQYVEDKKQLTKETITQRTFSIDYISKLITTHKITSYEAFQRTLPTDVKIQLLKQLGYVGQNIIKPLIKIHTVESLKTIKTKHYYQIILDNFSLDKVKQDNVSWLNRLFSANNISVEDFFSKFLAIHSTNITKINTLVLQGPTNTGKSLLANILLSDTKPTRIARERDKSNFHLDQLPNSTAVTSRSPSSIKQPSVRGNYFSRELRYRLT